MDRAKQNEAKDPNTSPERLQLLSEEGFARGVARNPNAPPALLETLSFSTDPEVKGLVAQNPNTPIKTLFRLGVTYPARVVRNPLLPLLLLENPDLFSGISQESLRFMLTQKDIPEAFLAWACQNNKPLRIREAIARNPQTPTALLEELLFDAAETVREGAAKNPGTPQELLQNIRRAGTNQDLTALAPPDLSLPGEVLASFLSRGHWAKRLVARHPNTPVALLETLAKDKHTSWDVYVLLAQNPNTPHEILRLLSSTRSYLKQSIALNPRIPEDLFLSFLTDPHGHELRESLARNPSLSVERLLEFSRDANCGVRAATTRHPKLPAERRLELHKDKSLAVRRSLVHSPDLSPAELESLSKDNEPKVRRAVASFAQTPQRILRQLCLDPRREVREAAERNLHRAESKKSTAKQATLQKKSGPLKKEAKREKKR